VIGGAWTAKVLLVNALAFCGGFSIMSLELLGGRILAPWFGGSIYVWGSIITVFMASLSLGYLLGGAIIIEQVFSMGGTGRLLLQAIQTRDFPLIQGGVIMLAIIFSLVNFLADIFVILADPRSRI